MNRRFGLGLEAGPVRMSHGIFGPKRHEKCYGSGAIS
jgi:hypothetical protein